MLNKGHICEGQIVRHSCDNPWCVNPDHLDLGTHAENAVDSVRRNRRTNQKRTEEQVKGFLDAYFETKSIAVAAERSGLPMKFATEVAVGKAWTWLSDNHPAASLRKPNRKRRTDTKYALEDVEKALRLVDEGATAASVARDTGLREGFILKILHGQTWKWLSDTHPVCVAYRERMRTKD